MPSEDYNPDDFWIGLLVALGILALMWILGTAVLIVAHAVVG